MLVIKDQKDFNAFIRVTLEHLNKSTKRPHIKRRELEQAVSPALSKGKSHAALSSELKKADNSSLSEELNSIQNLLSYDDRGSIDDKNNFLNDLRNSIFNDVKNNVDFESSMNVSDFLDSIAELCQANYISNLNVNTAPNPAWFSFEEDKNKKEDYFFSFETPLGSFNLTYRVLILEEYESYNIEIINLDLSKALYDMVKDECENLCSSPDLLEGNSPTNALEKSLSIIVDSIISNNFSFKRKIEPTNREKAIKLIKDLKEKV